MNSLLGGVPGSKGYLGLFVYYSIIIRKDVISRDKDIRNIYIWY
jgi:hypothetical protein